MTHLFLFLKDPIVAAHISVYPYISKNEILTFVSRTINKVGYIIRNIVNIIRDLGKKTVSYKGPNNLTHIGLSRNTLLNRVSIDIDQAFRQFIVFLQTQKPDTLICFKRTVTLPIGFQSFFALDFCFLDTF